MNPARRSFALALLVAPALLSTGCAIFGGSPPERDYGSATLGEAAREARPDSSDKHRALDVGDRVPEWTRAPEPEVESSITVTGEDERGPSRPRGAPGSTRWHLGLVGGGGSLGGSEFEGFGLGGIELGSLAAPRWQIDLAALVLTPNLTSASTAGQGLKNEFELALDGSARYYLTPPHTFLGPYLTGGIRFGTLFWDYRRPVTVFADGRTKTLSSDYINYYGIYGGVGVSLAQARHFHWGLNLTLGARTYDELTFEGFKNDLFPATGYSQLNFEVAYRF